MHRTVQGGSSGKRRVLITDDNDSVRAVISFYFTALHCDTTMSNDINSTLTQLERNTFDLLVLDLYLGDEPGMEVLRWMNSHGLTTPTVLMSGSDDIFAVDQARRLGIIDFWPKPTRFQTAHQLAQRLWSSKGPQPQVTPIERDSSPFRLGDVVEQILPHTHPYNRAQHQSCANGK